jgi:hypothetical protein
MPALRWKRTSANCQPGTLGNKIFLNLPIQRGRGFTSFNVCSTQDSTLSDGKGTIPANVALGGENVYL